MINHKLFNFFLIFFSFTALPVLAQNITLSEGPDEIALNEAFKITLTVKGERLSDYDGFPEIPGFLKRGTSSSTSTNIINGQMSTTQSITQNYIAQKEGTYTLKPFTMTVNGKEISAPGKKIKVGPPRDNQSRRSDPFGSDPFDDIFGRRNAPQEFIDVEEDAFLALSTSKNEVYLGEGFTVTLAFYVAESNRAQLQFYDLGSQLANILKELRPNNSWEENFNIESISRVPVTINGKKYQQYKIYQATYFPLNLETITFPSVGLKLIKYQIAKNPSFFGRNKKENHKTFYTKAKTVKVKDLPPHPLKEKVAVGEYRLSENITQQEIATGQGLNYALEVRGEGNISAIDNPIVSKDDNFEIYDPNVRMSINRNNGKVTGEKVFDYYLVPTEPGEYDLKDYFSWVFFNTKTERYDTLSPTHTVRVTGESLKNEHISANDVGGSFYDQVKDKSNTLESRTGGDGVRIVVNIFIVLMLLISGWLMFKK